MEALLSEVKRVCDKAILTHSERLPIMFADRQEFNNFRKSSEQKFLSADTFTSYSKSFESRLKNLEGKLSRRFPLLTINRHTQKRDHDTKSYFNLDTIISILKSINLQWLIPIIVCLFICMLAVYLISSITT